MKPWEQLEFQVAPESKQDDWILQGPWVIRSHGRSRVAMFQPWKAPVPVEDLSHERWVVKIYDNGERIVVSDRWLWSTPQRDERPWRGFTFFERRVPEEMPRGSAEVAA